MWISRSMFDFDLFLIWRLIQSADLFNIYLISAVKLYPVKGWRDIFLSVKWNFLAGFDCLVFGHFRPLGCTIYYKIDIFGKEKSGCVFAEYYLFKPTIFIQNFIYIHFRIILTQFYINFSRQEHQIELLWVLSRSITKMHRFHPEISKVTDFGLQRIRN